MNANSFAKKISFLLHNRTFIYLLAVLAIHLSAAELYHNIRVEYDNVWLTHLHRFISSLILASPLLFVKKKRWVFSYLSIVAFYLLSIILYLRTYFTIMPLGSYLMVNNLEGLWPSIWAATRKSDYFIVLPLLCYTVFYSMIEKKACWRFQRTEKMIVCCCVVLFCSSVMIHAQKVLYKKGHNMMTLHGHFALEPLRAFKEFGIANFWVYQAKSYRGGSVKDKDYAQQYIENNQLIIKYKVTKEDIAGKEKSQKNLIVILIESFQSWLLERSIADTEITPYLNQLILQENTVYFPNMMTQVKDGRSSDAQLLINTGLLPLETGAASSLCSENSFPSLPEALKEKGYTTVSLLCDNKAFWNQEVMTYAYHFDTLHDNLKGKMGVEKADEELFKKAIPLFKELKEPFYAQLVTISSHPPYYNALTASPLENDTTIINDEVKYYMIAAQYVDQCIARFMKELKEAGLYDNSVIVITGDHEAVTFNKFEGRKDLKAEDCYVPFIIANSPQISLHTDKIVGQIDIYPTLLDVMNCEEYYFRGLGENLLGDSVSNCAMYRTGIEAAGANVTEDTKRKRNECWKVSDILLRSDFFKSAIQR